MLKFGGTLSFKGLNNWRALPPVSFPAYHSRPYCLGRLCSDDRCYVQQVSVTFEYYEWKCVLM
jgi:hypothetical protein